MINIQNLVKSYGITTPFLALDGISCSINHGEIVAITGKSGSGKTTLLNMIGALDKPTSGQIIVDGLNLDSLNPRAQAEYRREKVGFVFQAFNLVPSLTALENVMLPLIPFNHYQGGELLEHRAKRLLIDLDMENRIHHYPSQLSGGEQQRVAIGRAVINQPKIILADEPSGNLDTKTGDLIFELLQNLNETLGVTLLIVTHNESYAKNAQRVIELRDGKIFREMGKI